MVTPSLTSARVSSTTMFTASERPRPKLLAEAPVVFPGSALTMELPAEVALARAAPEPSCRFAPGATEASVWDSTRFSASEPAIEFLPPPAPESASAPKSLRWSPPALVMPAVRLRPVAVTTSLPMVALVVGKARLTATPAPTVVPVDAPVVTAAPSPLASASVLPLALSESAPPEVKVSPSGRLAVWETMAMLTPTAAATWSGVLWPLPFFCELDAEGVVPPEELSLPRLLEPAPSAKLRWSPTSWLTVRLLLSGLVRELSSSPGVPVAEAVASALVLEDPTALSEMAPAALMERSTVALTRWTATVTAIAKPSALAAAVADPLAWVSALATWVADTTSAPPRAVTPPSRVPSRAVVLTSDTATATTGVMASPLVLVVLAPFSALVAIV